MPRRRQETIDEQKLKSFERLSKSIKLPKHIKVYDINGMVLFPVLDEDGDRIMHEFMLWLVTPNGSKSLRYGVSINIDSISKEQFIDAVQVAVNKFENSMFCIKGKSIHP